MSTIENTPVVNLRAGAIHSRPVEVDFSEGFLETWEYAEATECPDCEANILWSDDHDEVVEEGVYTCNLCGGDVHADTDGTLIHVPAEECDETEDVEQVVRECEYVDQDSRDLYTEGPMMNYVYPIEGIEFEDARKLSGPLCVVKFHSGLEGISLCGGGMDFSWEICEAFIELGYLPPIYFCRLPKMAGMTNTPHNRKVVEACVASLEWAHNSVNNDIRYMGEVEEWLRQESERRAS